MTAFEPEPPLRKLAEGYFNEDFDLEAPTPDDNVRLFVADHPGAVVAQLADEIASILDSELDEDRLEDLWINDNCSSFEPETIGLTYRQWFERMLEILRAG